jgi:hypothetical protein
VRCPWAAARCFRQVEFRGNALHLLCRQPFGVQHHGERIAAEPIRGEYIDGLELQAHHPFLLCDFQPVAPRNSSLPHSIRSGTRVGK